MATRANALVVMTKAPLPGESKTRLVPPLTFEEAAALSRALLTDQLDHLTSINGAELFVAFAPQDAAAYFHALVPAGFSCFSQEGEDLGERMSHAFRHLFTSGFERILLMGSDLPPVPVQTFETAYSSLGAGRDVVLGPTEDGGYYMVGMSRLIADIFKRIHWSRSDVLHRTLQNLHHAGLSYELLPLWRDIDTPEDLVHLYSQQQARPFLLKNTVALLQELGERGKL